MGLWLKEDIPNDTRLFMRVHIKTWVKDGQLVSGAFQNHEGGMSTDWEKYATPQETQQRGRKSAQEYGVVSMKVENVRNVPHQTVEHEPEDDNRAHTNVLGEKDEEARLLLKRLTAWVLPPDC